MRIRRFLGALFLVTVLGAAAELILVEHTEDVWQVVPFVLLAFGAAAVLAAWRWPNTGTRQFVQTTMALIIASGVLGLWLHYRANAEFELEMYPALAGWGLFWKAIHGASPPSLAPGAMVVVGALGWIWSLLGDEQ